VIEDTVKVNFNIVPCKFQLQCAQAQLDRKDVITIAPTGAGKTLTFWIPLLFNHDGIVVLITALNGLGDQNITELQQLGISAVNLTGANATDSTIQGM
jgi:superfamily II DNA helicase RecQ